MKLLLVLPVLIPLGSAIVMMLNARRLRAQRAMSVASGAALLASGLALLATVSREGPLATSMGAWAAPFGIVLVADLLSAIMVCAAGMVALAGALHGAADIDPARERHGYHPLVQTLLAGVCGAFLTGDIFNLYVWFEVLLISSFALLALGGERAQLEGTVKYLTLNLVGSMIFLGGCGLLYAATGTLNMADLARVVRHSPNPGLMTALSMPFLVAFGLKAALVPLHSWLPASYHTPPLTVTAIFSGLLTKVGVYTLLRSFTLIFVTDPAFTHGLIGTIAALTMVVGVLGALAQYDARRLLSFHVVSQIGYLVMALAVFTAASLGAAVFFMVHVIAAKTALFFASGLVARRRGTYDLKRLGGMAVERPFEAGLFLVAALALAGLPPFSGFWAKLMVVKSALDAGGGWPLALVVVALAVGMVTLLSMMKIWIEAYWKDAPPARAGAGYATGADFGFDDEDDEPAFDPVAARAAIPPTRGELALRIVPLGGLVATCVALGLAGDPLAALAMRAGEQLRSPDAYVAAVLGAGARLDDSREEDDAGRAGAAGLPGSPGEPGPTPHPEFQNAPEAGVESGARSAGGARDAARNAPPRPGGPR